MIKFVSHRIPWKNKNAVYRLQISALVLKIFSPKNVWNMQMRWLNWHHTLNPILDNVDKYSYLGQFAAQTIEMWWAIISTGNTATAVKNYVPMTTHSFPVSTHFISISY